MKIKVILALEDLTESCYLALDEEQLTDSQIAGTMPTRGAGMSWLKARNLRRPADHCDEF